MSPSWKASRLPPGKTCAEAKDVDVRTRCRRRTWFSGERRMTDELGRGAEGAGLPAFAADEEEEDEEDVE
jgi:hypothetical protein